MTTGAYVPPTTHWMNERQETIPALRLLIAQRRLYTRARRWHTLCWAGFSGLGVGAPVLTIMLPKVSTAVGAVAGIWIFLSRVWFARFERELAARGADVQEQFDVLVFALPSPPRRSPVAGLEQIAALTGDEARIRRDAEREKLGGWYYFSPGAPGAFAVAVAQRSNVAYSELLLRFNANIWLGTTIAWAATSVVAGVLVGLTLGQFVLGVALPLLPAILDIGDNWWTARQAAKDRLDLVEDIESRLRSPAGHQVVGADLLRWQDQLYLLRCAAPPVSQLTYRVFRARNERVMREAGERLTEITAGNSGP
nr:S-4TM family putative pore-forming effector [Frankia tisae]